MNIILTYFLGDLVKAKTRTLARLAETQVIQIEPEHIIEYEWPEKSGDFYFIQVFFTIY